MIMANAAQSFSVLLRTISKVSLGMSYRITYPVVQVNISHCLSTWNLCRGNGNSATQSWTKKLSVSDNPSGLAQGSTHIATPAPLVQLVNTMKKKSAIKRRCKDCKIVIKDKRAYVICKTSPRHNQVQG